MIDLSIDRTTMLTPGDAAPSFKQRCMGNPQYSFDSAAGRYLVLCFYGSGKDEHSTAALQAVMARPDLFNDVRASFFGVSLDPRDEHEGHIQNSIPGHRHFWDFDQTVSKRYGVVLPDPNGAAGTIRMVRQWVVVDPSMRVHTVLPFRPDRGDIDALIALISALPPPEQHTGQVIMAPILLLPRVFEPEFCQHLIGLYESNGGEESGFMRQIGGKTVGVHDPNFKKRRDYTITEDKVIAACQARIVRRVVPEIAKVHQFQITRMERYIVSCYAAEDGGHFSAHRDNTTLGTAHRRFAISINLNNDFDGGEVCFPEYGPRSFKAPTGAAVVFSCSLLHRVTPVTGGRRYAFLPFVYDDAAARIRQKNASALVTPSDAPVPEPVAK
ncbi:MAG: 2OG-Fe(II) oxygenase [Roseinatronobacter sp.]